MASTLSASADWLQLYDQTEAKIVELNDLQQRLARDTGSAGAPRIKRDIRNTESILAANLKTLQDSLDKMVPDAVMPDAEIRRRQQALVALNERASFTRARQSQQQGRRSAPVASETNDTLGKSNAQLMHEQEADFDEHDEKLDDILAGVGRLKNMGENINSELLLHSDLLNDLDQGIDETHLNLRSGTKKAADLMKRDNSCTGMLIIIVLLLLIVVLLVL
ncbi:t-SNARE coiled-coil homology domain-containing protein [Plasmodiophora brassicae]|uniref:t-SNARE coiled-coil homology domain-containing protein n=1 Tax=Plasmodiophora brassicae TaxID=37360 RepID=A0A0G4J465_PLABS|nr:hypothetical protein PBRA_002341 [Plasmodiophora brassicae]SPQ98929.1 unnamed protein product [Plasmodiophora brassicae]